MPDFFCFVSIFLWRFGTPISDPERLEKSQIISSGGAIFTGVSRMTHPCILLLDERRFKLYSMLRRPFVEGGRKGNTN